MNATLTLRNDYLFKRLLGAEENKACLQDFLECVLDIEAGTITDLELLDKELAKDVVTDKTGILDVTREYRTSNRTFSSRSGSVIAFLSPFGITEGTFENSGTGYKAQAKIKRRRTCCTSSIYFCAATP